MDYRLHQYLVRTIIALCALATTTDEDARTELADASVEALQMSSAANSGEALRAWCGTTSVLIEQLRTSGADEHACMRASVALLRLRTALPAVVPPKVVDAAPLQFSQRSAVSAKPSVITKNQKRILDLLHEAGPLRTRDLVARLKGILSDRTIKRSLKELGAVALVRKSEKDGAMVYERVDMKVTSAI